MKLFVHKKITKYGKFHISEITSKSMMNKKVPGMSKIEEMLQNIVAGKHLK